MWRRGGREGGREGGQDTHLEALYPCVKDGSVQTLHARDDVVKDHEGGGVQEAGEGPGELFD